MLAHPVRRRDFVLQRFAALVGLIAALAGVLLLSVALGSWAVDLEVVLADEVELLADAGGGLVLGQHLSARCPDALAAVQPILTHPG